MDDHLIYILGYPLYQKYLIESHRNTQAHISAEAILSFHFLRILNNLL